ncbi:hypothetical protein GGS23DRAFT_381879 [Durotheca rogersii]|uniref:uncharacterized protein n=1 Tax=Durotheca rogersii TaxID=419775 RepID=UPI00221EB09D|nr:uncharacterized protein GGS23DRAFT_381879 [Durotheca rogersii]KAI5866323.1 hypothetical protein GGS23DRAFT_381879 [Durotheca rogersii]
MAQFFGTRASRILPIPLPIPSLRTTVRRCEVRAGEASTVGPPIRRHKHMRYPPVFFDLRHWVHIFYLLYEYGIEYAPMSVRVYTYRDGTPTMVLHEADGPLRVLPRHASLVAACSRQLLRDRKCVISSLSETRPWICNAYRYPWGETRERREPEGMRTEMIAEDKRCANRPLPRSQRNPWLPSSATALGSRSRSVPHSTIWVLSPPLLTLAPVGCDGVRIYAYAGYIYQANRRSICTPTA